MRAHTTTRNLWRAVLGVILTALVLVMGTPPAFAHDRLKSSSPAKDAKVKSVEEIVLEYTSRVRFPAVVLHDASGGAIPLGKPETDGPKVLTGVKAPLPPGKYSIGWRVVSSDGHPIQGEIPFTVTGPASTGATPSAGATTGADSTPPADATAAPAPSAGPSGGAAGASDASGTSATGTGVPSWMWIAVALLALIGASVWFRTARRRQEN